MFGSHLKEIRALMEIKRYQNKFKHRKRSVAEHSWMVAKITRGLCLWERDKFHHSVDLEKAVNMALDHDTPEAYLGDIISTTKSLSSVLKQELDKLEATVIKDVIAQTLPNSWRESYISLFEEMSEKTTIESKIVKIADLIDCALECMEDIELGNKDPYEQILKRTIRSIYDMNLMSGHYFLKYSSKDFGAYEYIDEDIKAALNEMDFSMYF